VAELTTATKQAIDKTAALKNKSDEPKPQLGESRQQLNTMSFQFADARSEIQHQMGHRHWGLKHILIRCQIQMMKTCRHGLVKVRAE